MYITRQTPRVGDVAEVAKHLGDSAEYFTIGQRVVVNRLDFDPDAVWDICVAGGLWIKSGCLKRIKAARPFRGCTIRD